MARPAFRILLNSDAISKAPAVAISSPPAPTGRRNWRIRSRQAFFSALKRGLRKSLRRAPYARSRLRLIPFWHSSAVTRDASGRRIAAHS